MGRLVLLYIAYYMHMMLNANKLLLAGKMQERDFYMSYIFSCAELRGMSNPQFHLTHTILSVLSLFVSCLFVTKQIQCGAEMFKKKNWCLIDTGEIAFVQILSKQFPDHFSGSWTFSFYWKNIPDDQNENTLNLWCQRFFDCITGLALTPKSDFKKYG